MSTEKTDPQRATHVGRRTVARLAAVQALYEIDIAGTSLETVLDDFLHRRWKCAENSISEILTNCDDNYFSFLVQGTAGCRAELDQIINDALDKGWTVTRLEAVLRAVFRVAIYELMNNRRIPVKVIINEYVSLARDFFLGKEPAMVNGVLDRLARKLRLDELTDDSRKKA